MLSSKYFIFLSLLLNYLFQYIKSECDSQLNCATCDSITNKCLTCPIQYLVNTNGACEQCGPVASHGCTGCNELNKCNVCQPGYYKTNQNLCNICDPSLNCATCTDSTSCLTCKTNHMRNKDNNCEQCGPLSSTNCLVCQLTTCSSCKEGYFVNPTSTCSSCRANYNCKTCNDATGCATCNPTYFIDTGFICNKCSEGCKGCQYIGGCEGCLPGYVVNKTDGLCAPCTPNCASCATDTTCATCKEGYFLSSEKCVACLNNCSSCNDKSTCKLCYGNFLVKNIDNTCELCSSKSSSFCTSCPTKGKCAECIAEYYVDPADGLTCRLCSRNCNKCTDNKICLKCNGNYLLRSDSTCELCSTKSLSKCISCPNMGECSECQPGYFLNPTTKVCTQCSISKCSQCTSNSECTQCESTYFLSTDKLLCKSCQTDCAICKSETECTICSSGFRLNSETKKCESCIKDCSKCSDSITCTECQSGFLVNTEKTCSNCPLNCAKCTSTDKCDVCNSDSSFNSNSNCEKCSIGTIIPNCIECTNSQCSKCLATYMVDPNLKCEKCSLTAKSNCISCPNQGECASCQTGYFIDNKTKSCLSCTPEFNCTTCSSENGCLTCKAGYYHDYQDPCRECPQNCTTCSNEKSCLTCIYGYVVVNGACSPPNCDNSPSFPFISLKDFSCSNCKGSNEMVVNSKFCGFMPVTSLTIVTVDFDIEAQISCSLKSSVYLVYGLFDSVNNLNLLQIQAKVLRGQSVQDKAYWIISTKIETNNNGIINYKLVGLKNSGESYSIKAFCYLDANLNSFSATTFKTKSINSKHCLIKLYCNKILSSTQKVIIANNIATNQKINKNNIFTDEGISAASSRRILEGTFETQFTITPDYTLKTIDLTSNVILQNFLADKTSFLNMVGKGLSDVLFSDIGVSEVIIDVKQSNFKENFPLINVFNNTISINLSQDQNGKIYFSYIKLNSAQNASKTSMIYDEYAKILNKIESFEKVNASSEVNFSISNATYPGFYQIYYFAENIAFPPQKGLVYGQYVENEPVVDFASKIFINFRWIFTIVLIYWILIN